MGRLRVLNSGMRRPAILALAAAGLCSCAAHAEAARDPCRLEPSSTVAVNRVIDAATLALADASTVRLAAIEPPVVSQATSSYDPKAAIAALAALVSGHIVTIGGPDGVAGRDRHGRRVAFAFVRQNGAEVSIQRLLLEQGHARVGVRVGDRQCAASLLRAERRARAGKLGLWSDPYYELNKAEEPAALTRQRGRLALVEGKVSSVRESGGTIYVNFGRRWSEDFTVTVAKRNERLFTAAGVALKELANRRVRVRGYVEDRGGPWIEAVVPEQIEAVEGN